MSLLVVANSHSNKDAARRDRLSATVECVRKLSQWEGEPPGEPIPPTCPSHDLPIISARQEPRPPFPNTLATVGASNASKPNRLLFNPAILRSVFLVTFPLA